MIDFDRPTFVGISGLNHLVLAEINLFFQNHTTDTMLI